MPPLCAYVLYKHWVHCYTRGFVHGYNKGSYSTLTLLHWYSNESKVSVYPDNWIQYYMQLVPVKGAMRYSRDRDNYGPLLQLGAFA
jgi:hypothetical protein